MPATSFNIKFGAVLLSEKNKPISKLLAQIEFYSVQNNQWTVLVESKTNGLGIFKASYEIPTRISRNDEITRALKDILSSGGVPAFRLTATDSKKQKSILGNVTKINIDNENLLVNINFGRNWFLPAERIIKIENNVFFATSNQFNDATELQNSLKELDILNKKLAEKTASIENLENEKKELLAEKENFKKNLESCSKEQLKTIKKLKECAANKEKINHDLIKLKKQFDKTKSDLKDCKANDYQSLLKKYEELVQQLAACKELIEGLKNEKADTVLKLKELNEKIILLGNEKNDLAENINELEKEKQEHTRALRSCQSKLEKCESRDIEKLEDEIKLLNKRINEAIQNLENCKKNKLELAEERDDLQSKLEDATRYNESDNPNKVEAKAVYSGIVSELKDAQELMKDSNFKIGNIKLNLKAMVNKSPTGINYEMLDAVSAKDIPGEAISTIELDVNMEEPREQTNSEIETPNLLGLTETAVRKRLNAIGYKLNPVYNAETGTGRVIGQSYKQTPAKGDIMPIDKVVTVFFTKSKN